MATTDVRDPAYQCWRKRPYSTKKDAKGAARSIEQRAGRLHVYRCPHCGSWHIGHRPRRPATP